MNYLTNCSLIFHLLCIFINFDMLESIPSPDSPDIKTMKAILVPCYTEDSVLTGNGICIGCLNPKRYIKANPSKECNIYDFLSSNKGSKAFSSHLWPKVTPKNKNSSIICEEAFVCLKRVSDIGKLRRLKAAVYLNSRTLRVVTIQRHPFVKIKNGEFSGVSFEFFFEMQNKFNFSSTIFLPYDGNWGSESKNGTWNGMVGQVLRKEADIGVAGFSVTLERAKVISFTQSYHQEGTGILIPPPTEGEKFSVIVRPLSLQVWVALFATMAILAPSLYAMHILSLRISGEKNIPGFFTLIGDLIHFMIGSLVQESVISPVNKTTRFLIMLWWLLTLIIANVYVGYLVSYLSAPKLQNLINTLEDLVEQDEIQWTFRKNTAHQSLFKSKSSVGVYKRVGDGVSEDELVTSDLEGVQAVLTGEFAFIKETSYLDVALANDFVLSHQCRMTLAKEEIFKVGTALIVQKRSKFLDLFDYGISWTVATGIMEKWKTVHWPRDTWCQDAAAYITETKPKTRKLTLDDLQGAEFLLGCGLIASLVGFIFERLVALCLTYKRPELKKLSDTTSTGINKDKSQSFVKVKDMNFSFIPQKFNSSYFSYAK